MSTSIEPSDITSSVRQRFCKRDHCENAGAMSPNGSGQSKKCCDESCLVRLASRNCAKECSQDRVTGHAGAGGQCLQPREDEISSPKSDGLDTSTFAAFPCPDHYKKVVVKYGALLENLGCICKVLLSLNLESCCVLPHHGTAASRPPKKFASNPRLYTSSGPTTAMQAPDESKGSSCGTRETSTSSKVVPEGASRLVGGHSKQNHLTNSSFATLPCVVTGVISTKTECPKRIGKCRGSSARISETNFEKNSRIFIGRGKGTSDISSSMELSSIRENTTPTDAVSQIHRTTANRVTNSPFEMRSPSFPNCSEERCCSRKLPPSSSPPIILQDPYSMEQGLNKEKKCCNEQSAPPGGPDNTSTKATEYSQISTSCCGSDSKDMVLEDVGVQLEKCLRTGAENKGLVDCNESKSATKLDECCQGSSGTTILTSPQSVDECMKNFCYASHMVLCDSDADTQSTSPALPRLQATDSVSNSAVTYDFNPVDVERDLHGTQSVTIQVQGMTCTGCEKKLFRLLTSLPEVSAVKTSLLLAQAEFSLRPSDTVNADNIANTLQRMTGFKCSKVAHFGEELDLFVEGSAQDYADHWPPSIIDLTLVSRNQIRVRYYPKAIGARELLSDPFFRHMKLAPPSPSPLIASGRAHLWKSFYMTLFSAACTVPVLVLAWGPMPKHEILYGAVSLALATVVQSVVAGPFYISAAKTLVFSRMAEMDLLIVLSTTTAYIYSIVAYAYLTTGKPLSTGQFFETSTLLVTLIMVGRTVSSFARQRAVESITIESLQINSAILIDEANGEEKEIDARLLQYNDIFKILPDMSVVTDGIVLTGESELDESLITGESALVHKGPSNTLIAGSVNHSGSLTVQVTRLPCENTIKTIGIMVDEAKSSKPKVQELADRVASYFIPAILVVTVVVFIAWVAVGKTIRNESTTTACITGMTYAISVLIVSCPCAIGLAVPMVVVIAGGVAARHGLIFKTAETIDTARKVTHVIFDKTGTLTQGKLRVTVQDYLNATTTYEHSLILGLTANSTHPVSLAIAAHLRTSGVEPLIIEQIASHPGKGIEAQWRGSSIRAGNPYWLYVHAHPSVSKLQSLGLTLFCVTLDANLIAVYGLRDELRPDALSTITTLRSRGIAISLLSGDNDSSVHAVAAQLRIEHANVRARCTPGQKRDYVKSKLMTPSLRNRNRKEIVLFCGDGTNDAPSLAQASIGVHISNHSGSSSPSSYTTTSTISSSAADAVIMPSSSSLKTIITLIDISAAFHRRVVFNFVWCFAYNLSAVLLAAGAFAGGSGEVRIRPEYAGLGELVSVLPVIFVAMGLKLRKF